MEILSDPTLTSKLLDNIVNKIDQQQLVSYIKDLPVTIGPNANGILDKAKSTSLINKQQSIASNYMTTLRQRLDDAIKNNAKIAKDLGSILTSRKGRAISTTT